MSAPPFVFYGPAHVTSLVATAVAAVGLSLWARRHPAHPRVRTVRLTLAGLLVVAAVALRAIEAREGIADIWDVIPLDLCDVAIFVAAYALVTLRPLASETLYFWACAGTSLAMITPDINAGFPSWRFVSYFGLHGAVVVSAVFLVWGLGQRPRPGAPWRILLLTNVYAAAVAVVNLATGANFLYLCRKPSQPTLLDYFGPWPVYILVAEVFALVLFTLLYLPTRRHARA